jgi:hypothetical protein
LTLVEAQDVADAVGLGDVIQSDTTETPVAEKVGTIESQDPLSGTSVLVGTNVEVVVFILAP